MIQIERRVVLQTLCSIYCTGIASIAQSQTFQSQPFVSTLLVSTDIEATLGESFADYFLNKIGVEIVPGKAMVPGTFSNAEIKHVLSEFDRITTSFSIRLGEVLQGNSDKLAATIEEEKWNGYSTSDERVHSWARRNQDFLVEAQSLSNICFVLWALAPNKVPFPIRGWPEYERMFGDLLAGHRYRIQMLLNLEEATSLLPARFNVSKLRQQELEIRSSGKFLPVLRFPDGQLVRTTIAIKEWLIPMIRSQIVGLVHPELEKLAIHARCLANKKSSCA
jgi:hypothetical protein